MILIVYRTVLRGPEHAGAHAEMTAASDALAATVPGFISSEAFHKSPLETVGLMYFADEDAVAAWREHQIHQGLHVRGVEEVYQSYNVEVFELVRQAGAERAADEEGAPG